MDSNEQDGFPPITAGPSEPIRLETIMQQNVIRANLDATLGDAMTICFQHRIRHLPILNNQGKLAGLVTDRDLRFYISYRLGTIMENNSDRETLRHRVNVMMVRRVITGGPKMTVADAARLMLDNHVGCLPVVDAESHILGIVTAGDFLRLIAEGRLSASAQLAG